MWKWKKVTEKELDFEENTVNIVAICTDWCGPCKDMKKDILAYEKKMRKIDENATKSVRLWLLDGDDNEANQEIKDTFNVTGFPFWIVVDGDTGEAIHIEHDGWIKDYLFDVRAKILMLNNKTKCEKCKKMCCPHKED